MITVVIPVGPHASNTRWLPECLDSVFAQTMLPEELLIINDTGIRNGGPLFDIVLEHGHPNVINTEIWNAPWNMGVAHAFNAGVGLARTSFVFLLGSDDTLEPTCLEECDKAYVHARDDLAYYSVGVKYMDTGELQTAPCNAAMVTKALWRHTGGFPTQSAVGAPDAALLSIMFGHGPAAGRIRPVADGRPLYNYRRHNESDTASKSPWQGVILAVRDLVTREWRPRT